MSNFFILTHASIVGPLTGVELREAALAGILHHECVVGATTNGPWHRGTEIGLFSQERLPIPHPEGTFVPRYHVRGMAGAFDGPLKLRELIGFASRGMLSPHAELQAEGSGEWLPVQRFRVLASCLTGEFVLSDGAGKLIYRTEGVLAGKDPTEGKEGFRPPLAFCPSANRESSSNRPTITRIDGGHERLPGPVLAPDESAEKDHTPAELEVTATNAPRPRVHFKVPSFSFGGWSEKLPTRGLGIAAVAVVFVSLAVGSGMSLWGGKKTSRHDVTGSWVATENINDAPRFAISFDEEGRCVIFNQTGLSWSGDYEWHDRESTMLGGKGFKGVTSRIDEPEDHHLVGEVLDGDGYLILKSFKVFEPVIDGHVIRDLFVRRSGDELKIGYLTEVAFGESGKRLNAGWVTAVRGQPKDADQAVEQLLAANESSTGELPTIAEGIELAKNGITRGNSTIHETRIESDKVDTGYLLANLVVPDEARPMFPNERPDIPAGTPFDGVQLVRYDNLLLMLDQNGRPEYLRWMNQARGPKTGAMR